MPGGVSLGLDLDEGGDGGSGEERADGRRVLGEQRADSAHGLNAEVWTQEESR